MRQGSSEDDKMRPRKHEPDMGISNFRKKKMGDEWCRWREEDEWSLDQWRKVRTWQRVKKRDCGCSWVDSGEKKNEGDGVLQAWDGMRKETTLRLLL